MKIKLFVMLIMAVAGNSQAVAIPDISPRELCKYGVATNYGRSVETMAAQLVGSNITRVQYTREQDGRRFSFQCKLLNGNRMALLDETLGEPRWYGEDLADSQITYRITETAIIIRTIGNGVILRENLYSIPNQK